MKQSAISTSIRLAVFFVLLGASASTTSGMYSRLTQAKASQAKPGPKIDYVAKINELARAGRDESLNAAPFYQKAAELYVEMPEELMKLSMRAWPTELSAREQSLLKQWMQSNSQALLQLELGARRPYYWQKRSSPDGSTMGMQLPGLAEFRQLAFAIIRRAKLNAAEGNIDKAVADILTCYRFGLHVSNSPTLIEQLVGLAVRSVALNRTFEILGRTKPDTAALEALQREFEQLSTDESYILDMRAEKFAMLDFIQRVFTDDGKGDGRITSNSLPVIMKMAGLSATSSSTLTQQQMQSFSTLRRRRTTEAVEKAFQYYDGILKKTPWEIKNEKIDVQVREELKRVTGGNVLIQMFFPEVLRVAENFARCRADTDALITTLTMLRYKADNGRFPARLDELVSARYLNAVPSDPFSGRPFVYKPLGNDFTLYSFAVDCDDDGGTRSRWGTGEKGGDQVFWPVEGIQTTGTGITRPQPRSGAANLYPDYENQARQQNRTFANSTAEPDILADPNKIKARIKTFEGLEKALKDLDRRSQSEMREWMERRVDNRVKLARAVELQVWGEIRFIRKVAVEEEAKKTTKEIDDLLLDRQERFRNLVKTIEEEMKGSRREIYRPRQRSPQDQRTRERLPREDTTEQDGSTGVEGSARAPEGASSGVEDKNQIQISQWLQAGAGGRTGLAKAVQEHVKTDFMHIRKFAVAEGAQKTVTAIDGLSLDRLERSTRLIKEMEKAGKTTTETNETRRTGGSSRTRSRYDDQSYQQQDRRRPRR